MKPILFELGPVRIFAFGTFIVLAFLVSSWFVRRRAERHLGLDGERVFNLCFVLLFVALLGARMLHVFLHYGTYTSEPLSFLKIWEGGLAFYGGLLVSLAALAWYLPRSGLETWKLLDVFALGACLAIFVGRWASFLSGENWGKVAEDLPWAIPFPIGEEYSQVPRDLRGIPLHPTQLYHSLHGIVMFGILMMVAKRALRPGRLAGLFLMLYAVGRGIIEIWRADDTARVMVVDGHFSSAQLISIPVFFIGLAIFLLRRPAEDESMDATA